MTDSAVEQFTTTGRFDIQRRLGAGGMGIVYKAYDRERDEVVALKTMRHVDGESIYRFKKEFRLLAELSHSNLVSLYELLSLADQFYFTMEFVDGVSFEEYIRLRQGTSDLGSRTGHYLSGVETELFSQTPSEPAAGQSSPGTDCDRAVAPLVSSQLRRLRSVLKQLVAGISALHEAGFLHRDIKPSNVLVTRKGRVVLLDFGLATEQQHPEPSLSTEHHIVGTLPYMAPEQAAGLQVSPASDWYSVGVMLFEALVGRRPFEGNPLKVGLEKQQQDPPRPGDLCDGIPDDLEGLCVDLLKRSPEDRPPAEEIHRRLGIDSRVATPSVLPESVSTSRSPFVGRDRQMAKLSEAMARMRQGRTAAAFVSGRSGEGKSALVRRFLEASSQDDETVVLTGRCYERETVPYKALDSIVDALSRYLNKLSRPEADTLLPRDVKALARVFPVLRRVEAVANAPQRTGEIADQQELRQRAFAALRELLARLGDRKTLVLYIDDLQWGDLDSAKLLGELLRPPNLPVLLLLACYRDEDRESSAVLRTLLEEQIVDSAAIDVREVSVGPLSYEESCELANRLLEASQSPSNTVAAAIARESAGNPYLVDALVRHYLTSDAPTVGISLDEVLWARVCGLSDPSRLLLEAIAVAGHPLRQADACRSAGVTAEHREALGVLRTARLIRTRGAELHDWVETYHDRIRESVVAHLPDDRLADCHHRLAMALAGSEYDTDPATLAEHYLGAGQTEEASRHYVTAARQAADALAFDRAVTYYRLALESGPWDKKTARSLRTSLADALANAGRGLEAAREYDQAAEGAPAADSLDLRRNAALQSLISGHIDDGLNALGGVLGDVGMTIPRTPRRALLSLLFQRGKLRLRGLRFRAADETQVANEQLSLIDVCWSAATGLSFVDPIRGADFQARCLLLALQSGEPQRIARSLALEAGHVSTAGVPARQRVERLLTIARELGQGNPYADGLILVFSGLAAFLQGRWQDALEEFDRGEAILRENCTGVVWELNTAQAFALWALFYMGQVAELRRRLPILTAEARDRGNLYALANLGTISESLVALADDDPDGADRNLRHLMQSWSREGYHVQHATGLFGRVQIEVYRNDGEAACEAMEREWPAIKRSLLLRIQAERIYLNLAHARGAITAASNTSDPQPYLTLANRLVKRLERERVDWGTSLATLLRAGILAFDGQHEEVKGLLITVSRQFDDLDMYLFAAAARRRLGQLIGGEEGAAQIQAADDWMASQGIQNPVRMAALHAPGFPSNQH